MGASLACLLSKLCLFLPVTGPLAEPLGLNLTATALHDVCVRVCVFFSLTHSVSYSDASECCLSGSQTCRHTAEHTLPIPHSHKN